VYIVKIASKRLPPNFAFKSNLCTATARGAQALLTDLSAQVRFAAAAALAKLAILLVVGLVHVESSLPIV
jgi:hypothetical protein